MEVPTEYRYGVLTRGKIVLTVVIEDYISVMRLSLRVVYLFTVLRTPY